jgi:ankyrin repeat protein
MHVAALNGHVEVVRELLKMGGNPNTPDRVCETKKEGVSRVVVFLFEKF